MKLSHATRNNGALDILRLHDLSDLYHTHLKHRITLCKFVTHLAGLNLVNPSANFGFLQYKRIILQKLDVAFDRLFEVPKLQEVNRLNLARDGGIARIGILYNSPEVIASELKHTAARVVEYGYLSSAEQALGDNYTSKSFLSA